MYNIKKMFSRLYNYFFGKEEEKCYYLSLLKTGDRWHIHGLWPQYTENSYPTFCKKVEFDINKLSSILPELNEYWYSQDEKPDEFWQHEWEKHGSCMFQEMDELQYFSTTLGLYKKALENGLAEHFLQENDKSLVPLDIDLNFLTEI